MATTAPTRFRSTGTETRHCKEDALSDRQFERMVEATYKLDGDYFSLEARLIVFAAGRLGLRSGEICHMRSDWIDWRENMIQIPRHETCEMGRDGGVCGCCRQSAKQMIEYNDDLTLDEALSLMWGPKTKSAAREVPLDATPRAAIAIEDYFDRFDTFQSSQTGINRRVNRTAELADGVEADSTYPHCLRATAASHWAGRGLNAVALKSLMGWSDFSVALKYIEDSGKRTSRALRSIAN